LGQFQIASLSCAVGTLLGKASRSRGPVAAKVGAGMPGIGTRPCWPRPCFAPTTPIRRYPSQRHRGRAKARRGGHSNRCESLAFVDERRQNPGDRTAPRSPTASPASSTPGRCRPPHLPAYRGTPSSCGSSNLFEPIVGYSDDRAGGQRIARMGRRWD